MAFLLVVIPFILMTTVGYFYLQYKCFIKESIEVDHSKWNLIPFVKLAFSVEDIVSCLQEKNVIGIGVSSKIYKATIRDREVAAVKKLLVKDDKFQDEVAILANTRHKNIVKLMSYCTNGTIGLLVFEYLPNGSVDDVLHGCNGCVLDWPTRYKIILDVANGLSYMHHDCIPPILHRDIKPNNILLDEDFNAKIIDFGEAKIIGQTPNIVSIIVGSCGYIAPEYAYTLHVNENSDVSSFGVVILELITGRSPIDPEFGEKNLVKWVWSMNKKNEVDRVIDQNLELKFREKIRLALKAGLYCTRSLPNNRPSMKVVARMLHDMASS